MKRLIFHVGMALTLMVSSAFAADVDGSWNLSLSAAEGSTSVGMTIKVDGETATAEAAGDKLTGTYIDGELKLKGDLFIADAGFASKADMTAKMEGNRLVGLMMWEGYALDVVGSKQ